MTSLTFAMHLCFFALSVAIGGPCVALGLWQLAHGNNGGMMGVMIGSFCLLMGLKSFYEIMQVQDGNEE